jgi:hypothetical protein
MDAINRALNDAVDMHAGADEEKIQSTLASLDRLLVEFERPENRELISFAVAWKNLDEELAALQAKISERIVERATNKVDEFLKKLIRRN